MTTLHKQAIEHTEEIGRWEIAQAAVGQADPGGDPKTLVQLVALRNEIENGLKAAKRDRALLDRLVDIRSAVADDPDKSASDNDYAEAFRAAGIDLSKLPPAEAGAKIKARPPSIALALARALDDWAVLLQSNRNDAVKAVRLSEAARVADPDPWRIELRTAFDQPDPEARRAALEALSKKANFDALGPITLHLLGVGLNWAGESALAESVLRRPSSVIRRMSGLTTSWAGRSRNSLASMRRFASTRPRRAIRPETAHELAHALEKRGNYDEAIAVLRDLRGIATWQCPSSAMPQ